MTALPERPEGKLDELRGILWGSHQNELARLQGEVENLHERIAFLESKLVERTDRAGAIGEVLPAAFDQVGPSNEALSVAMKASSVRAIHHSARDESDELAIALYPVLGPAVRKMIANLLSFGPPDGGTFAVEQVLLIERESGLLLAATAIDGRTEEADIVSGMLDAIRLFVQDAFHTPEHDGLQDLRVGNISVLVEWGPRAVLASVVRGVPDEEYRLRAAELLETLHRNFEGELSGNSGIAESLNGAVPMLHDLRTSQEPARERGAVVGALIAVAVIVAIVVILLILL